VPEQRDITTGVEDALARAYDGDRIALHVTYIVGAHTPDETRLNQTSPIDHPWIWIPSNSDAAGPASGVYAHGLAPEGLILHAIDSARRIRVVLPCDVQPGDIPLCVDVDSKIVVPTGRERVKSIRSGSDSWERTREEGCVGGRGRSNGGKCGCFDCYDQS